MNLIANNLSMSFDDAGEIVNVFADVNLELEPGTSLAIVGNSGIGKTTLLSILGGLEKPITGSAKIGEDDCFRGDSDPVFRAKNFGFVFQSHNLLSDFTALENVMIPLLILGQGVEEAKKEAQSLLDKVGLSQRQQHKTLLSVSYTHLTLPTILLV